MTALLAGLLCAAAARTAEAEPSWSLTGVAGVVSDYRWRGVSQTDGRPALQGQLTATDTDGVYLTVWGSNIADWRDGDGRLKTFAPTGAALRKSGNLGQALELSASLGRTLDLNGWRLDVAVTRYGYPGGPDGYFELPLSATRSFGPATVSAGFSWAPPQPGTGGFGDRYVYGALSWNDERWPVKPRVSLGHCQGAFGNGFDWSAGLSAERGKFAFSLDLVGARQAAGSTLVAAIQRSF